jgi:hypothetical protein
MKTSKIFLFFFGILLMSVALTAQPSGGPYGPVQQYYEIPDVPGAIYFVSPDGDARVSGLSLESPTTIETAIEKAVSGDAVVLRGGTYRTGNLTFNQHIVIQPYQDEHPVLKGTKIADTWEKAVENLWVTNWPHLFPGNPESWWPREREERFTPLHRLNNNDIFIDRRYLQ